MGNPSNLDEYLSKSDIYLSTSLFEGLSNSIMEAMAYSLPIIATDVGDNNYLVQDGYNGFVTNVKDVDEIAKKLLSLVIDKEKRLKMGHNQ